MLSEQNNWKRLAEYDIQTENDIVLVRQSTRQHAKNLGLGIVDQTRITTAASELFRNMYLYANGGQVIIDSGVFEGHNAFIITCIDQGPGIDNLDLAMTDGYTSGGGMGYGLPGSKRLVDFFEIESVKDKGTEIRLMKWI